MNLISRLFQKKPAEHKKSAEQNRPSPPIEPQGQDVLAIEKYKMEILQYYNKLAEYLVEMHNTKGAIEPLKHPETGEPVGVVVNPLESIPEDLWGRSGNAIELFLESQGLSSPGFGSSKVRVIYFDDLNKLLLFDLGRGNVVGDDWQSLAKETASIALGIHPNPLGFDSSKMRQLYPPD